MENNYERFSEEFRKGLMADYSDVCFFIYGSFARGDHNYKSGSDIDGGLILDSGIITNKNKIISISRLIGLCLSNMEVPLQFNVLDRQTNLDGRFLSYTVDYTDWIKDEGRVLSGPSLINEMNGIDYKSGVLNSIAFNLRSVRKGLLESSYESYDDLIEKTNKAIDKVVKTPKKLIWLTGNNRTIPNRYDALESLKEIFPDGFDDSELYSLNQVKDSGTILNGNLSREELIQLWANSLTSLEKILAHYIETFPNISPREAKISKILPKDLYC